MEFFKILAEISWLLRHRKRISYAALRQAYKLDDAGLEAVRVELVLVERIAQDLNGQFLLWSGEGAAAPAAVAMDSLHLPSLPPLESIALPTDAVAADVEPESATATDGSTPVYPDPVQEMPAQAERRQLTVLFCDLIGSTELSTRLDPEDLQDIIRAYQAAATRVILEYEGFIAKYMGDGILVYFGYPHATERNAAAAVKAALGIVQAMPALNEHFSRIPDVEIAVRIGIATGVVVVGEITGEGEAKERTVIGETPNLAARLQGLAQPNGIVVSEVTRDLAGDLFVYEDMGPQELKGIQGSVNAWIVVAEQEDEGQSDFLAARSRLPLVGRQEELGLLTRAWETSHEGLGQVVLIQGEAGIGKSRLLSALRDQHRDGEHAVIRIHSSPYHTASTLYPVIEYLKHAMHWKAGDSAQRRFEKLEGFLQQLSWPIEESVPIFAALLSLPLADSRYAQLKMNPTQQRDATLDAIVSMFLELAEHQPVLMLWEDLHWADPTTVELLGLLINQVPTVRILIVITYRPEFVSPWPVRSHIAPITLNRLERAEVEGIVTHIGGGRAMPLEVLDHIATKADGVPLYVEELTRTILEAGILQAATDRYELIGVLADMHIPETLQDSLMARLDRNPMVREVAQIAAVLGREFAYEMIAALAPLEPTELQQGLRKLVEDELLYQRGRGERAYYVFKHALIHDAAYESLLKRARQKYHRQVAQLLEERFPEMVDAHPEIAAHHYTEAGNVQQAIRYWQTAGKKAAKLFAHREAISHLHNALKLVSSLPESPERARTELELHLEIGPSIGSAHGFACPEYGETYRRARELSGQLGEESSLAPILRGLTFHNLVRGEIRNAIAIATEFVQLTERQPDGDARMYGQYSLGNCLMCSGRVGAAREHLANASQSYQPDQHDALVSVYGIDVGVAAQGNEALCLWLLGHPDAALERVEAALTLARQHAHPFSLSFAWTWKAIIHQYRGEPESAADSARQGMEIALDNRIAMFTGYSTTVYGWALAAQGKYLTGIRKIHQGQAQLSAIGVQYFRSYFCGLLVDALLRSGRRRSALHFLGAEIACNTQERIWRPELHRLHGELHQCQGSPAATVTAHYRKAVKMAQTLEMQSLELRAAVSLGRFWQQQGETAKALDLLKPVCDAWPEGEEGEELKLARALLAEIA